MKLLLDTHTFIWWNSDSSKLSKKILDLCGDRNNIILLSLVSIWEIEIKSKLGKLTLNNSLSAIIKHQKITNNIQLLPINLEHILQLETLNVYHKDPFDHLLIVQAMLENATLLSKDSKFGNYPIKVEW
ncbi:type II toxin-antitoxin system VapC family toxin [Aphanothece sacrum]|uniref:PilT protein domain protein n=1 Tax=Aphanothece sacrum FPU1 TaxID=1920663 RepID=A0A401IJP1_APHSA|nr:type II toxin-antitoxin system VapC family toxin [Aphanothece sacrum]GBF81523.1 PilT protein domain protein [Aphanothece sacrum FPU1]GBF86327.1 PilT protein domain protein [Aphanothece sacrum FPU3]